MRMLRSNLLGLFILGCTAHQSVGASSVPFSICSPNGATCVASPVLDGADYSWTKTVSSSNSGAVATFTYDSSISQINSANLAGYFLLQYATNYLITKNPAYGYNAHQFNIASNTPVLAADNSFITSNGNAAVSTKDATQAFVITCPSGYYFASAMGGCVPEFDKYANRDCPGGDIKQIQTASQSECLAACRNLASCTQFGYAATAVSGYPQGTCWLKSSVPLGGALNGFDCYIKPGQAYQSLDCYRDVQTRVLPVFLGQSDSMTVGQCFQLAQARNLIYFGVQNSNQCFGSAAAGFDKFGPATCDMRCAGNNAQICGGSWANSVYQRVGVTDPFLANQVFQDQQLFCTAMKKQYCIIPTKSWGLAAQVPQAQATWSTNNCDNHQSDHDEYCASACDISKPNTPGCSASDNTWCTYDSNYYGCLIDHAGTYGNDGRYCRFDGNYFGCIGDHGVGPRALDGTWCREDGNRDACLGDHRVGGTFADDGTYCRQDGNYQGCLNDHSGSWTMDGTFCRHDHNYDGCMADHNHNWNPCSNTPNQIIVQNQMSDNSSAWITTYTDGGVIKIDWGMGINGSIRRFCAGTYSPGSWYKVTAEVRGQAKTSTRFKMDTLKDGFSQPEPSWLVLKGGKGVNPYFEVVSSPRAKH